jgi:hypothetical protein
MREAMEYGVAANHAYERFDVDRHLAERKDREAEMAPRHSLYRQSRTQVKWRDRHRGAAYRTLRTASRIATSRSPRIAR